MSTTDSRYVLAPRTPMRAFLVAAALVLVGALLVALLAANGAATVWLVLAAIVLVAGLALAGMGLASMRTMRTFVELDPEGYHITGPQVDRRGTWTEVTRVTTSAEGAHLTLYHGEVARTHILCPTGGDDPQMQGLVADIARHLDDSRGYGETFHVPLIDPHNPDPDVVS